mgnify:CR=1 FL=1
MACDCRISIGSALFWFRMNYIIMESAHSSLVRAWAYSAGGTLGENNPAGEGFKLDVTIELNLSASGYVVTLLFGAIGVQLVRND